MVFQRRKVASALAYMLGAGGVVALNAVPAQAADIKMDITGSSIRRVEAEGALPVTVVTREDIARTGALNTEQLLQQTVSALSTIQGTNLATGAGLSTYGQTSVSLRGLGPSRTLVLVNGRRLAPFAGDDGAAVNVNSIPVSAIERIEVLRDGASAVYGSDAMAGVINFILSKDYTGVEVGGQYGAPTRSGGGESWDVTRWPVALGQGPLQRHAVRGLREGRNPVGQGPRFREDRQPVSLSRVRRDRARQHPGRMEAGNRIGGEWHLARRQFHRNVRKQHLGNPLAAANNCEQINMFKNPTNVGPFNLPFCAFDSAAYLNLLPEREAINGSVSFLFDINKDLQFFADGLYANQKVTNAIQPSPVRNSFYATDGAFDTLGIDRVNLIYPNNPSYQIAANYLNSVGQSQLIGQPLAVTGRVFDFGLRTTEDESTQWRAVVGLRGNWANNDWEVAYTHNENKVEGKTTAGYFSQTSYARAIQQSNDYNPWSLQQSDAFNQSIVAANYIGPTLNSTIKTDTSTARSPATSCKCPRARWPTRWARSGARNRSTRSRAPRSGPATLPASAVRCLRSTEPQRHGHLR